MKLESDDDEAFLVVCKTFGFGIGIEEGKPRVVDRDSILTSALHVRRKYHVFLNLKILVYIYLSMRTLL